MLAAVELYPHIPITMHQDHGNSVATCKSAIENGFTSVMMDGSLEEDGKTPASFDYNVRVTKEVVKLAHAQNVSVEGELGCLGSLVTGKGEEEDGHGAEGVLSREQLLTDPNQAAEFVKLTNVDALAVAIGTSHGAYKFTSKPTGEVLAMIRIEQIHKQLPNTHLVMHGSSSVPQALQDIINKYGGKIKQTYGVPIEEIQRGIKHGVRKINVDTDNRLAITGAIRKVFCETPDKFDPRDYLKPARTAMKQVCVDRMVAFGQAGLCRQAPQGRRSLTIGPAASTRQVRAFRPDLFFTHLTPTNNQQPTTRPTDQRVHIAPERPPDYNPRSQWSLHSSIDPTSRKA